MQGCIYYKNYLIFFILKNKVHLYKRLKKNYIQINKIASKIKHTQNNFKKISIQKKLNK